MLIFVSHHLFLSKNYFFVIRALILLRNYCLFLSDFVMVWKVYLIVKINYFFSSSYSYFYSYSYTKMLGSSADDHIKNLEN